jgi:hypothetical protein
VTSRISDLGCGEGDVVQDERGLLDVVFGAGEPERDPLAGGAQVQLVLV